MTTGPPTHSAGRRPSRAVAIATLWAAGLVGCGAASDRNAASRSALGPFPRFLLTLRSESPVR